MPDVASSLQAAGFSDDEITAWSTEQREHLRAAGFSDQEVDGYLGIPRTPDPAPQAFLDRLAIGAKIGRVLSGFGKGFSEGLGNEPYGLSPETQEQLQTKLPMFNALWGPEVRTIASGLDAVNRLIGAGVTGVAEAIGQAAEEAGQGPAEAGRLKRDIVALGQVAPFAAMGAPVSRIGRMPGGKIEPQEIGRLPTGQDIMDAGRAIGNGDTTPAIEAKLTQLYEQKGVHPAEVAHDAQTDPVVAQSMLSSDPQDLPYGNLPNFAFPEGMMEGEIPANIERSMEQARQEGLQASVREPYIKNPITGRQKTEAPIPPMRDEGIEAPGVEMTSEGFEIKPIEQPPSQEEIMPGNRPEIPYTDAEKDVLARISVGGKAPEAKLTWGGLYTNVIDKLFPISKAVKGSALDLEPEDNPYTLARLMSGHVGKADHFLNQGTFDFGTYENNGASLKEVLAPVADDLNGFRAYTAARRTLELEGRGIKSGFDVPSAEKIASDGSAKYETPFRQLVDYQNRVSQYLRDSGVLSDAGYKAMLEANQQYVPFSRVMGLDPNARMRGGSSLQARNPIKVIKGSAREIIDPLESVVRNTYHFVEMAERNQVGTKLVDMLQRASAELPEAPSAAVRTESASTLAKPIGEALGEMGVKSDALAESLSHAAEPVRNGEIAILRDGKREVYKVDPDLAQAMKGLNADSANLLTRILAGPTRLLRAGAVLTPDFWGRHTIRDFIYGMTTYKGGGGAFTPVDMAKGFTGLIMKDEDYWNWLKGGGGQVSSVSLDRQYMQQNLQKLTGETGLVGRAWNVMADPEASMWQKAAAGSKLPFQAIEKFAIDPLRTMTHIVESASHLAAFKKTLKASERAEPEATNLRDQLTRAAWVSRDTAVDAARMGAGMRSWNQIIAFANIKLLDTDRVVRALKDDPINTMVKITAGVTIPSVVLWSINHDDPDYQEIPQWEKDLFWIIPIGSAPPSPLHVKQAQERGVEPTNSAQFFFRMPKPWAMGMVFGTLPERLLDAFAAKKPEAFKDYAKDLWAVSGPDFIPTAASPIVDQFANRSTFTNRTLIPAQQEKFLPEYQYTPYTTELAKRVGEIVGAFPGMEARVGEGLGGPVARAISSPILMENYIRGWTGTLGVYALQAADAGLRKAGVLPDPPQPAWTLADIPFIKAFVVRYPTATTESIQSFNDEYASNKTYFDTFMAKAKEGDARAMQHIQEMGGPMMFAQLDGIHQALSEHSKLIRDVYKNPEVASDEKRQLIDQLYYSEIQVARYGRDMMRQMRTISRETLAPGLDHGAHAEWRDGP